MTTVIYDADTGEVIATGDAYPDDGEKSADIPESNITEPITGTSVDSTSSPTKTERDSSLPQEADVQERRQIRELAEIQKRVERINQEINNNNIPSRSDNANVDAVMSEWETRRDELRNQIG